LGLGCLEQVLRLWQLVIRSDSERIAVDLEVVPVERPETVFWKRGKTSAPGVSAPTLSADRWRGSGATATRAASGRALRTTNAIDRLYLLEFRRRVKTQGSQPSEGAPCSHSSMACSPPAKFASASSTA